MNITQSLWSMKEWTRVKASGNEFVLMVHEATNEAKWGPTGAQMEEICRAFRRGSLDIMEELRWRMKNRDKSWRACYKSLLVLDYLARNCTDAQLPEVCSVVPTLRIIAQSFYYTNPKGIDHGISVRERAKNLADLMSDGLLLREERAKAAQTKAKLARDSCDGGGPANYNRYGGYPGPTYGNTSSRSEGMGSGYRPSGGYDPYRPASYAPQRAAANPSVPRTKEEQEQADMEVAMRMQREEERRSGVRTEELEAMFARQAAERQRTARQTQPQQQPSNADEEFARKLQEEEENRARREGRTLPTFRSESTSQPATVTRPAAAAAPPSTTSTTEPTKEPPAPPKPNVLDDLFAPPPAPAAPAAGAASTDAFDAFLDKRVQQQQQQDPWGQPQQTNPWGQPQQAPQQSPWGQPQQNPWGQQQQQQNPWGQPQQQQQSPQQNPWGQPQQQQQAPQPFSSSGVDPSASSHDNFFSDFSSAHPTSTQPPSQSHHGGPDGAPPGGNAASFFNNNNNQHSGGVHGDIFGSSPSPAYPSQPPAQQTPWGAGGNTDSTAANQMWGSLDQFTNQQQRQAR